MLDFLKGRFVDGEFYDSSQVVEAGKSDSCGLVGIATMNQELDKREKGYSASIPVHNIENIKCIVWDFKDDVTVTELAKILHLVVGRVPLSKGQCIELWNLDVSRHFSIRYFPQLEGKTQRLKKQNRSLLKDRIFFLFESLLHLFGWRQKQHCRDDQHPLEDQIAR